MRIFRCETRWMPVPDPSMEDLFEDLSYDRVATRGDLLYEVESSLRAGARWSQMLLPDGSVGYLRSDLLKRNKYFVRVA